MSSDAMTYALEHGIETEFKDYKTRHREEWKYVTKNCRAKKIIYDNDEPMYTMCKCVDEECAYETCFARFCHSVKS